MLDANLMLVFVVSTSEPLRVAMHKRTRSYTSKDYYRLRDLIAQTKSRIVTPHILTEVSNHLAQSESPLKHALFRVFVEVLGIFDEIHVPAKQIAAQHQFAQFGLTDLGILEAASSTCVVLTADSRLASYLKEANVQAVDYKELTSE